MADTNSKKENIASLKKARAVVKKALVLLEKAEDLVSYIEGATDDTSEAIAALENACENMETIQDEIEFE